MFSSCFNSINALEFDDKAKAGTGIGVGAGVAIGGAFTYKGVKSVFNDKPFFKSTIDPVILQVREIDRTPKFDEVYRMLNYNPRYMYEEIADHISNFPLRDLEITNVGEIRSFISQHFTNPIIAELERVPANLVTVRDKIEVTPLYSKYQEYKYYTRSTLNPEITNKIRDLATDLFYLQTAHMTSAERTILKVRFVQNTMRFFKEYNYNARSAIEILRSFIRG